MDFARKLLLYFPVIFGIFLNYKNVECEKYRSIHHLMEKINSNVNISKPQEKNYEIQTEKVKITTEPLEEIFATLLFLVLSSNNFNCPVFYEENQNKDEFMKALEIEEHKSLFLCPPCKCYCCALLRPMAPEVKPPRENKKPQHANKNIFSKKNHTSSGKKLSFYHPEECPCPECPPCTVNDCDDIVHHIFNYDN